jgi:hypothetical protein
MRFHVEMIARDNFDPMSAVPVQKMVFDQMDKLVKSGKVEEHGIYSDERGGFLILNAESPEELFEMISPLGDAMMVRSHPYVSMRTLKSFFDAYEERMKK